jgi:hypothetical protein
VPNVARQNSEPRRDDERQRDAVEQGMMVRIHITGASGSGCTTLGRALADRLGCASLDTDDYFWRPSDPPFPLSGWGDVFIPLFDLAVFLWVPPEVRLARLREREVHLFGEEALAPGGRMHETHEKFMAWAADYDTGDISMRSRARHEQWLQILPCPVVRLEGGGTVQEHVAEVMRHVERRAT